MQLRPLSNHSSTNPHAYQGFLMVDGAIQGNDGLTITANGASITGDTQIDGSLAVTGALVGVD